MRLAIPDRKTIMIMPQAYPLSVRIYRGITLIAEGHVIGWAVDTEDGNPVPVVAGVGKVATEADARIVYNLPTHEVYVEGFGGTLEVEKA